MIGVHAIRTGSVRIKAAQRQRKPGGLLRTIVEKHWTQWLPIYCWLIESPHGLILVDTGETARTAQPGYLPRWHPYFRTSMQTRVEREEEIGPQLVSMGIDPRQISLVILTHLHTDHAGGLGHFREVPILVSRTELRVARGLLGRLLGYLPGRWPSWFAPQSSRLRAIHRATCRFLSRVMRSATFSQGTRRIRKTCSWTSKLMALPFAPRPPERPCAASGNTLSGAP